MIKFSLGLQNTLRPVDQNRIGDQFVTMMSVMLADFSGSLDS